MYSRRKTETCSEPFARTVSGFQPLRAYKVQDVSKTAYTCYSHLVLNAIVEKLTRVLSVVTRLLYQF